MDRDIKQYNDFMKWFKENHPELHEKYHRNIELPFVDGGGVGINNSYKISADEHKMLHDVAKTYYLKPE